MHAGGAPAAYDSHLDLWSRDPRHNHVCSGGPAFERGGMLTCSSGFPDPYHNDFLSVSSNVPFASAASKSVNVSDLTQATNENEDDDYVGRPSSSSQLKAQNAIKKAALGLQRLCTMAKDKERHVSRKYGCQHNSICW